MIARPNRWTAGRGFTLVELVATIVVLGIVGSIASFIIFTAMDSYGDTATSAQLRTEESIAVDRIVRCLRSIERDDTASGVAADITDVTASSMTWEDSNGDTYSLSLSGDQLMFVDDGAAAAVLLDDVSAFSVQTYDEGNVALPATLSGSACDPIRRVAVSLTLQRYGRSQTLRTKVFIRSTMAGTEGGS